MEGSPHCWWKPFSHFPFCMPPFHFQFKNWYCFPKTLLACVLVFLVLLTEGLLGTWPSFSFPAEVWLVLGYLSPSLLRFGWYLAIFLLTCWGLVALFSGYLACSCIPFIFTVSQMLLFCLTPLAQRLLHFPYTCFTFSLLDVFSAGDQTQCIILLRSTVPHSYNPLVLCSFNRKSLC